MTKSKEGEIDASKLKLFQPNGKWLDWDDSKDEDGQPIPGAKVQVEERLLTSLNASNLLVLLGSGASFAAHNNDGLQAPSMRDLWDAVKKDVTEEKFDEILEFLLGKKSETDVSEDEDNSKEDIESRNDIEALLSLCKMSLELISAKRVTQGEGEGDQLNKLNDFLERAEKAILDRVDFVSDCTELKSHKNFLRRLARRSADKSRVKMFTTNYDRCIEQAASYLNIVLIDGFSHSVEQRFDRDHFQHDIVYRSTGDTVSPYIDEVFHLYKLHGSMDWRRRVRKNGRANDGDVIRSLNHEDSLKPVLIYPRSSKYQEAFSPPYLDMFSAWQSALRVPDTTLIVSGFGFADDHISRPIWAAIESNLSFRLILCDPCFVSTTRSSSETESTDDSSDKEKMAISQNPYLRDILKLVEERDNRVMVLNGTFDDLALAFPDVVGDTTRQSLKQKMANLLEQHDAT